MMFSKACRSTCKAVRNCSSTNISSTCSLVWHTGYSLMAELPETAQSLKSQKNPRSGV